MQSNINQYQQTVFQKKFVETDIFKTLQKDYPNIVFDNWWKPEFLSGTPVSTVNFTNQWSNKKTGRELAALRGYFDAVAFYYLDYLLADNPAQIYDLGCGANLFKKYIPNIIGIGAELPGSENFHGDIHGIVNEQFIQQHQNYFNSVFSFVALHFIPLTDIRKRVLDFYSMITPGGKGVLTLDLHRMLERTTPDQLEQIGDVESYIRSELYNMPFNYLVFDLDISQMSRFCLGNIRMVISK
jgi:hypothetical protein